MEADLESGALAPDASAPLARRQQGEQAVASIVL